VKNDGLVRPNERHHCDVANSCIRGENSLSATGGDKLLDKPVTKKG